MIITSKSALIHSHMLDKKEKGAKCIEVHLTTDTLNMEIGEHLNTIKKTGLDISAVHAPFEISYEIEGLIDYNNYQLINRVFKLADEIGKVLKKEIFVIMHMNSNIETFRKYKVLNLITSRVDELLSVYRNTNLAIENSQLFIYRGDEKKAKYARLNYLYESAELVKYLNKSLNSDIGTVFDTCHAIANVRLFEEFTKLGFSNELSLSGYFEEFKDTVKIIHLANSVGLAYGNDFHAQPFTTEEDKALLAKLIMKIKDINFNGYLTLEVNEDDYTNSVNWVQTKKLVDELMLVLGVVGSSRNFNK